MAITTEFNGKAGVALVRYDHALAEWFFVAWANRHTYIMPLPPGMHTFQLWLVVDSGSPITLSMTSPGTKRIAVIGNKR